MHLPDDHVVDATLASSLESLDDAVNYRNWIVELCEPHLGSKLLEVGAGHGTFTEAFAERGRVVAVEPGAESSVRLHRRFDADPDVITVSGMVDDVQEDAFDAAVMINVLEHIDDEIGTLDSIHRRLAPGGRLLLWVPAFMLLYSPYDRRLGHHRRYRRKALVDLVEANGYEVTEARYANLPGWFSWLLLVRLLRQEPTGSMTVQAFDRLAVPVIRRLERRLRVPFGQSLFVVAHRR